MSGFRSIVVVLFLWCQCSFVYSQNSFEKKHIQEEYAYLARLFSEHVGSTSEAKSYAEAFLAKAKKENNFLKIADAYYMLASISETAEVFAYTDSIIAVSKDRNFYGYPAKAHILKANFLGSLSRFREAMDELAAANEYANAKGNIEQQYQIKYFIALLKNDLGAYEESLALLKEVLHYYEDKYAQDARPDYVSRLFARNESYMIGVITSSYAYGSQLRILEKYEEAEKVNKKAIDLSLQTMDSFLYDRILLSSSLTHYHKKEYRSSLDSLLKSKKINTKKKFSLGTSIRIDILLGRIFLKQGKNKEAVAVLKQADSIAIANNYFFSGKRLIYEILIDHYKERNNLDQQLFYINKLLQVDSILDTNVQYLSKEINEAYTTPNLLLEKERLIESLEKNNSAKAIWLAVLTVFTLFLIVFLVRDHRKQKIYKRRFLELLHTTEQSKEPVEKDSTHSLIAKKPEDIGVPETIVNDILKNLEQFEQDKDFLQDDISVARLSKKFNTNVKYFSKVVNTYKNKSFTTYINELRVYYLIDELKTNTKYRKYTIKAIANEIGFNTTEAFSKSFYKTTGIYPSFFIKQLEKSSVIPTKNPR